MARNDPHTLLTEEQRARLTVIYFNEPDVRSVDDLPYKPAMARVSQKFNEFNKENRMPELSEGDVWRAVKRIGKRNGGGLARGRSKKA